MITNTPIYNTPYLNKLASTYVEPENNLRVVNETRLTQNVQSNPQNIAIRNAAVQHLQNALLTHEQGEVLSELENDTFAQVISNAWGIDKELVKADIPGFIKKYTGVEVDSNWAEQYLKNYSTWKDSKTISYYQFAMNYLPEDSALYKSLAEKTDQVALNQALKSKQFKNYGASVILDSAAMTAQLADQLAVVAGAMLTSGASAGLLSAGGMAAGGMLSNGMLVDGTLKVLSVLGSGAAVGREISLVNMSLIEAGGHAYELRQMKDENGNARYTNNEIARLSEIYAGGIYIIEKYTDALFDPIMKAAGFGDDIIKVAKNAGIAKKGAAWLGNYVIDSAGQSLQEGVEASWSTIVDRFGDYVINEIRSITGNSDKLDVKSAKEIASEILSSGIQEAKDSFGQFSIGGIPTTLLSGLINTDKIRTTDPVISAQMKADANSLFVNKGDVYDISYIDTLGEFGTDDAKLKTKDEEGNDFKYSPVYLAYNQNTDSFIPVLQEDRKTVAQMRLEGKSAIRGIVINAPAIQGASAQSQMVDISKSSNVTSEIDESPVKVSGEQNNLPSGIIDRRSSISESTAFADKLDEEGLAYAGTKGNTIYFDSQEDLDKAREILDGMDISTSDIGNGIDVYGGINTGKVYNYRLALADENTSELDFRYNNLLNQDLENMSQDERDNALSIDWAYNHTKENMPGVSDRVAYASAIMANLASETLGIPTDTLMQDKILVLGATDEDVRTQIEKQNDKGTATTITRGQTIEGWTAPVYDEEHNVIKVVIRLPNNTNVDAVMEEYAHALRFLATPEQLAGFNAAAGYTGTAGAMWVTDIQEQDGKYYLGNVEYDSKDEAVEAARANEELFAEQMKQYIRDGNVPNSEIKSFLDKVIDLLKKVRSYFSKQLSAEARKALDHFFETAPGSKTFNQVFESIENGTWSDEDYPVFSIGLDQRIQDDYNATEAALRADYDRNFDSEGHHLAPNGQRSNLSYKQWVQVRTPAFIKWFGDWINDPENASKILDENGEPRIVYHGSPVAGIEVFDPRSVTNGGEGLIYATNSSSVADRFSLEAEELSAVASRLTGNVGDVYSLFSNLRNPLDFRSLSESDMKNIIKASKGSLSEAELRDIMSKAAENNNDQLLKVAAQGLVMDLDSYGYDGIIARMYQGDDDILEFGVINRSQFKSATDNNGAFSADNDSTLYSLSDDIVEFRNLIKTKDRLMNLLSGPYTDISQDTTTMENAEEVYRSIKEAVNIQTGDKVVFVNNSFGKIRGHKQYDPRLIGQLKNLFETSIFLKKETPDFDTPRKDGTRHKNQQNIDSFSYYLNTLRLDGSDYLVRFTVQDLKHKPNKQQSHNFHSQQLSNVQIEKINSSANDTRLLTWADTVAAYDERLANYFLDVNSKIESLSRELDVRTLNVSMDKDSIVYSIGDTQLRNQNGTLIVTHGISQANLDKVDELGGLPMPSLAITKPSVGNQFGDVILVGDANMGMDLINSGVVYDRDIWSPMVPRPEYKRKAKKIQAFDQWLRDLDSVDGLTLNFTTENLSEYEKNSPEKVASRFAVLDRIRLEYCKENGIEIDIPYKQKEYRRGAAILKAAKAWGEEHDEWYLTYNQKDSLYDAIKPAVDNMKTRYESVLKSEDATETEKRRAGLRLKMIIANYEEENYHALSNVLSEAKDYEEGKQEIDSAPFVRNLDEVAPVEAVEKWLIDTKLNGAFSDPMIKVGRSMVPYDVENVFEYMLDQKRVGNDFNTMTFSNSLTVANAARVIGSRSEMQTKEQFLKNQADEYYNSLFDQYHNIAVANSKWSTDTWELLDDSNKAIADYLRGNSRTDAALKRILSKYDFTPNAQVMEAAKNLVDMIETVSRRYFEAKPEKIMQISDFKAALVPDNVSQKTLDILNKAGIEIRKYSDKETAVQEYAVDNSEVLFSISEDLKVNDIDTAEKILSEGRKKLPEIKIDSNSVRMNVSSIKELYDLATDAQGEFANTLRDLQVHLGLPSGNVKLRNSLKGYKRVIEKTLADYDGDVGRVIDVNGGTFFTNTFEEAVNIYKKASDYLGSNVVKKKSFKSSFGYEDWKVNFRTSNGFIGELIIIEDDKFWMKENGPTHKIYEAARKLEPFLKPENKDYYMEIFGKATYNSIDNLNNNLADWSRKYYENSAAIRNNQYDNEGFRANWYAVASSITELSNQLRLNFASSYGVGLSSYTLPSSVLLSIDTSNETESLLNGVSQMSKYLTDIENASISNKTQISTAVKISETESMYKLSPQRLQTFADEKSELIRPYRQDIIRAVQLGEYVDTRYLEYFKDNEDVAEEIILRQLIEQNPDIRKDAEQYDEFNEWWQLSEKLGLDPFEEPDPSTLRRLERIFNLAHMMTKDQADRAFALEWTSTDSRILDLANKLRSYKTTGSERQKANGDFVVTRFGAYKGVSTSLLRLRDRSGLTAAGKHYEASTHEEIEAVRQKIIANPAPYREAYQKAYEANEYALHKGADWFTGEADTRGLNYRLDQLFKDVDRRQEKARHIEDLRDAGDFKQIEIENLKDKLDRANSDLDELEKDKEASEKSLKAKISKLDDQYKTAEMWRRHLSEQIDRMRKERTENKAEIRDDEKKIENLRTRLKESADRARTLKEEKSKAERALDALRRREDARDEMERKQKTMERIIKIAKFNSATSDASFEDLFAWVRGLFDKEDRANLYARRSELLRLLSAENIDADLAARFNNELEDVRQKIRASELVQIPHGLQVYFSSEIGTEGNGSVFDKMMFKDNRPSTWSEAELDFILNRVQIMKMDAQAVKGEKDARRRTRLNDESKAFFYENYRILPEGFIREDVKKFEAYEDKYGEKYKAAEGFLRTANATPERLARLIDGNKEGVAYNLFIRRAWNALFSEVENENRRKEEGLAKFKELGLTDRQLAKTGYTYKKDNGMDQDLTRGQMIGVYVYAQSDLGAEKIQSTIGNGISPADVEMIGKNLTASEKAWGDYLLSEMGKQYDRIRKVYYEVYNQNLGERPAYFPLVASGKITEGNGDILTGPQGTNVRYTDKGFTKAVNPYAIYALDLNVTDTWLKQVKRQEHFIAFAEWTRDTNYQLGRGGMGDVILQKYGKNNLEAMQNYVSFLGSPQTKMTMTERIYNNLLGSYGASMVVGNLGAMLKQLPTLGGALMSDITLGNFMKSVIAPEATLSNFLKANDLLDPDSPSYETYKNFIYDNDPQMKNRRLGGLMLDEAFW